MYLQWSKIDVGQPDFRESNRLFYIFWEACKADKRSYGMCYLKNRRSDFLSCPQLNPLTLQQYQRIHGLGYCPNLVPMQRRCSQIRLYQFRSTTRSSFKPIQDGMDRPKTELAYRVPASKFTRRKT